MNAPRRTILMTVSWRQFRSELADILLQLNQGDTRVTVMSRGKPVLVLGPENLPTAQNFLNSRTRAPTGPN